MEGEKYGIEGLNKIFTDARFYSQQGTMGKVTHVGYYHSLDKNELVYMLPKVFIEDGKVFGKYFPEELFSQDISISFKNRDEYAWARKLLVFFYKSISEYQKRYINSNIIDEGEGLDLSSNLDLHEYSYLDLMFGFVNHYRRNKNAIMFHYVDFNSSQAKKPKWEKTVKKVTPILNSKGDPLYLKIQNKKKTVNDSELLICYFFSILNKFKDEHGLDISINKSYKIIRGKEFIRLQETGISRLRSIKHKYFADSLKRMYKLCELYFLKTNTSGVRHRNIEFVAVRNYNLVFEDMVDKLFSDSFAQNHMDQDITIAKLKHNADGKILDHIYEYGSLVDTSNIFYIGDSKYYRPGNEAGKLSMFKQFTYAKNILQYNIDLFVKAGRYHSANMRYRDIDTEGYNITPNFFIYGYVSDVDDFDQDLIESYGEPVKSSHFPDRLFDRDTLFVHQYKINFLFVLKSYSSNDLGLSRDFKLRTKQRFRNEFVNYFNKPAECGFKLYSKVLPAHELQKIITDNFKVLNGKSYIVNGNELIIARPEGDTSLDNILTTFDRKVLL
uniref:hypothetical protein n=1 Tax=Pedobacter sp. TaxID=1411316 RepID=UPI0015EF4B30|nr:hypothetical protein [Pedobacter sp.]